MQSLSSHSKYWVDGFPELVREWDHERNGDLKPSEVSAGSGRAVWWICSQGPDHRWRAKPNNRSNGTGCPFCANRRVSVTNSLAARFPELAMEWDPENNGSMTPADITATSTRIAWWRCAIDPRHVWRVSVRDRTKELTSCPFCSNDRACETNSLKTRNPKVASQWHTEKNGALSPDRLTPGSSRRVWWQCERGHEWRASVANRVSRASGCPVCAGRGRPVFPSAGVAAPPQRSRK
jgi:hypothetical protein